MTLISVSTFRVIIVSSVKWLVYITEYFEVLRGYVFMWGSPGWSVAGSGFVPMLFVIEA